MPELTAERARELFSYDQLTGRITRIIRRGNQSKGSVAGYLNENGYVQIEVDGRGYLGHRVVWLMSNGAWPENEIDHINGVRSDNRVDNLRDVTRTTNNENKKGPNTNSSTGFLGVSWRKSRSKYRAAIKCNGRQVHLGYFSFPEEAHEAYIEAKRRLHEGNTL